jgi:hypothetical protein
MPFDVFIFPLAGGYYFLIRSRFFKYYHQRLERQRLLLNSVLAGIGLLILSSSILMLTNHLFLLINSIKSFLKLEIKYFDLTFTSLLLGILFGEISNVFIPVSKAIENAIDKTGNPLEKLIKESFLNTQFIQITLMNDKIYIGWALSIPEPKQTEYINFFPVMSGFRKKGTKKMEITTRHQWVINEYLKDYNKNLEDLNIKLVIPVREIVSLNTFDPDLYEQFEKHKDTL